MVWSWIVRAWKSFPLALARVRLPPRPRINRRLIYQLVRYGTVRLLLKPLMVPLKEFSYFSLILLLIIIIIITIFSLLKRGKISCGERNRNDLLAPGKSATWRSKNIGHKNSTEKRLRRRRRRRKITAPKKSERTRRKCEIITSFFGRSVDISVAFTFTFSFRATKRNGHKTISRWEWEIATGSLSTK